jgi:hypothetical protein
MVPSGNRDSLPIACTGNAVSHVGTMLAVCRDFQHGHLLTALTAVARKVIVLPPGTENKPALMAGFGVIVLGIAAAYWLVLMARRNNPEASPSN